MSIKIYTKTTCPYCTQAKALLTREGLAFEEINLERKPEEREPLIERTNYRKVPQIFINDEFIGGFSELQALKLSGRLQDKGNGTR